MILCKRKEIPNTRQGEWSLLVAQGLQSLLFYIIETHTIKALLYFHPRKHNHEGDAVSPESLRGATA